MLPGTVLVQITASNSTSHVFRALFDSGSIHFLDYKASISRNITMFTECYSLVKQHQRCFSCLGSHKAKCISKYTCRTCQKSSSSMPKQTTPTPQHTGIISKSNPAFHLSLVQITVSNGTSHVFRTLLNSGSMNVFISERAADLLSTQCQRQILTASNCTGISKTSSRTRGCTDLKLSTLFSKHMAAPHTFHILDKISVNLLRT